MPQHPRVSYLFRTALAAAAAVAIAVVGAVPADALNGVSTDPNDGVPRTTTPVTYTRFPAVQDPGLGSPAYFQPSWYDTDGRHIQAHGGDVVTATEGGQTVYYWYGEDRTNGYWNSPGVAAYRSTDLMNWTNLGDVLRTVQTPDELTSPYFDALYDTVDDGGQPRADRIAQLDYHLDTAQSSDHTAIFERPKVLHNERTGQWVMWWHSDGRTEPGGSTYARSMAGVAVSDSPTGPFRMVGAYRMPNRVDYTACSQWAVPGQARDMTVFQDAEGAAYIVYSSEENSSLYVARLDDDFTNVVRTTTTDTIAANQYSADGRYPYVLADGSAEAPVRGTDFQIVKECGYLEAPAMFTGDGLYNVIASGATGWNPNPQTYYTSESVLGTWRRGVVADDVDENTWYANMPEGGDGLLSVGDARRTTFGSQSTGLVNLGGGRYIYMGDRWNEGRSDSTYVWLPIVVGEGGRLQLHNPATEDPQRWAAGWDTSYWDDKGAGSGTWTVQDDRIPTRVVRGADVSSLLPTTVHVSAGGVVEDVPVTWSGLRTDQLGTHALVGVLAAGQGFTAGRTFERTVSVGAPGLANIAPSASVTASSRQDLAGGLTDGSTTGKAWDDWSGAGFPRDSTLDFAWTQPQTLNTVSVFAYKDGPGATWPSRVDVLYRDDAGQWVATTAGADIMQDPAAAAPRIDVDVSALPATTALRLRLRSTADTWQSIAEVQIWGTAPPLNVCTAEGTTVAASFSQTEWGAMPASFACDGRADTSWSTWTGLGYKDEVTFTLQSVDPHVLDQVRFTTTEGAIVGIHVAYRDPDGAWQNTDAVVPAIVAGAPVQVSFPPVRTSALRMTFHTPASYLKIPELVVPEAPAPTAVTVAPSSVTLRVGETSTLSAQVLPDVAPQAVAWASTDPTIAAVDGSGVVTARSPGTATVSARSATSPDVVGTVRVTVIPAETTGGGSTGGATGGVTVATGGSASPAADGQLAATGASGSLGAVLTGAALLAVGLLGAGALILLRRRAG